MRRDGAVAFHERDVWATDGEGRVRRGERADTRVFRFRLDAPRAGAEHEPGEPGQPPVVL